MSDREERSGRCPDGGYCHGTTVVAGSAPCEPGNCYRVRYAGPLSGVFPGDRWPEEVRAAHAEPEPPENVRVVRPDGTEIPVELVFDGMDEQGMAVWVNAQPLPAEFGPGWRILCAKLPAKSTIAMQ